MKVVLDAGALVAIDRQDRRAIARIRVLQREQRPLRVSAAVLGQVWRDGRTQVSLARFLRGIGIEPVDPADGKLIGELLARAGSVDVVDAHVALMAQDGDLVWTSDPNDIETLLDARRVRARVQVV